MTDPRLEQKFNEIKQRIINNKRPTLVFSQTEQLLIKNYAEQLNNTNEELEFLFTLILNTSTFLPPIIPHLLKIKLSDLTPRHQLLWISAFQKHIVEAKSLSGHRLSKEELDIYLVALKNPAYEIKHWALEQLTLWSGQKFYFSDKINEIKYSFFDCLFSLKKNNLNKKIDQLLKSGPK